MTQSNTILADIIAMGTELTTGASTDTNSAWLSARLLELGVSARRHVTIADDLASIVHEIGESARAARVVVMTGGLGPTADDVTREALAEAAGESLVLDDESLKAIESFYASLGRDMPETNRRQAMRPQSAVMLPNNWGTAPGLRVGIGDADLFSLPGVPREMKAMFAAYVVPAVEAMDGRTHVSLRVVRTFGTGESNLAEQIGDLMTVGRNPSIGTTASEGVISVRIVATADSDEGAQALAQNDVDEVRKRLGVLVYGEDDDTLASVVGRRLAELGQTVSTAESCSGGMLGAMLTDVPGSSAYYLGGFIPYSYEQKSESLGIPMELIQTHGAVSEPCAKAMAERCRTIAKSDYALAITGIAGPGGGTEEKPVGLVYIAMADSEGVKVKECRFSERLNREVIRDRSARTALNMLRRKIG
ncbi:MAG: competence/damage-inducible protein A [Phycisphaerae bacterium]|nr:MAG: competence/damage-inducible protein A [Phycisphaerae bacterium]